MSLHVVILAAGMGKRMKSDLPKVLHPIADVPMLGHVVNTAKSLAPDQIIVIHGHGGDRVRATLNDPTLTWAEQTALIGTGNAVKRALPFLPQQGKVLILYGDVPLITATTLQRLLNAANDRHLGLLTAHLADPTGYGRIVRNAAGNVAAIVEQKDAHPAELAIGEINTGLMCVQAEHLHRFLARLTNNNAQQEYYLTDIIAMAVDEAIPVVAVQPDDVIETLGVNDRAQLAQLERAFQRRQSEALLAGGLAMADPSQVRSARTTHLRARLCHRCQCHHCGKSDPRRACPYRGKLCPLRLRTRRRCCRAAVLASRRRQNRPTRHHRPVCPSAARHRTVR